LTHDACVIKKKIYAAKARHCLINIPLHLRGVAYVCDDTMHSSSSPFDEFSRFGQGCFI
jgi:hypothetical protein